MATTHQRQTSLPPPYQAHTNEAASMPYLDDLSPTSQDLYQTLPYFASLPAFDAPPNFSRRLRRLIEKRRRPTQLSLVIPVEKPKIIEQIFYDNDSCSSSSSSYDIDQEKSTNLLGMPCDNNLETYSFSNDNNTRRTLRRKYRRRSSLHDDREISWTAFAGMASVLFLVLCTSSIVIAWSIGLFQGMHGLEIMQAQMHGMENAVWAPPASGNNNKASIPVEESMVLSGSDAVKASNVAQEIAEDMPMMMSRREEIQKRAERRRRSARGGATTI